MSLDWLPPAIGKQVDGYHVYRQALSLSPGGADGASNAAATWELIGTTGDTTFTDTRLACGSSYEYQVAAYNAGGEGALSTIGGDATLACVPAAPSNLAASGFSQTGLVLSWVNNAPAAQGFTVQRLDSQNGWGEIGSTAAGVTSLADSGLACDTSYTYRVLATGAGGLSAPSAELVTGTLACTPVIGGRAGQAGVVTLTWSNASRTASRYYFERQVSGGAWTPLGNSDPKDGSFIDPAAPCGVSLSYRASAENGQGSSPWSNFVSLNTICQPTTVMSLAIGQITTHSILLTWTATNGGQTSLVVERSADATYNWNPVATLPGNATQYLDVNLPSGTNFFYRLRAVNAGGEITSPIVFGKTFYEVMLPIILKLP